MLTGCHKGHVPAALSTGGRAQAAAELDRLVASFGADSVAEGVTSPGLQGSYTVSDGLAALHSGTGLEAVRQADGSYGLQKAPSAEPYRLAPVIVNAQAVADDPAASVVTRELWVGGKVATNI